MKAPFVILLLAALPCLAAFSQPKQSLRLEYGQKSATVVFETDGCSIRKTRALCDCTSLTTDGTRLIAVVDTSKFDTSVDKQIDVTTSDGLTTRLTMHFEVPPALILSARSLLWKQGDQPTPQQVRISLPQGSPVHAVKDAGLNGSAFDFTPETVVRGQEYRITVTPKSTEEPVLNRLVIKTDSTDPRFRQQIIYLQVK